MKLSPVVFCFHLFRLSVEAHFEGFADGISSIPQVDPYDPRHPALTSAAALRGGSIGRRRRQTNSDTCDPSNVVLSNYSQWIAEEGYWVGEYSFYGPDGDPYQTESWPYRYDHYRGFITGATNGRCYRQRNVFMYPSIKKSGVVGTAGAGEMAEAGNTKIFSADQKAETCSDNPELGGDISGPFGPFDTYTSLIGEDDNAVLYQVYLPVEGVPGPGRIFQSQLTTINTHCDGTQQRTRTAQGFDPQTGSQSDASFYREKKVTKDEFYTLFNETQILYAIPDENLCATDGFNNPTGGSGFESCELHLEETFELECD